MADEKGGGGGSDWGALEIVLGILLAIALIDRLQGGKGLFKVEETPSSITSEEILSQEEAQCGLSLTKPRPQEKITGFVIVSGSITGCNWFSTPDVALYAQLVDSRGKPVSNYTTIVPRTYSVNGFSTFESVVYVTAPPAAGTGYLILVPSKQISATTITARIPIQFNK